MQDCNRRSYRAYTQLEFSRRTVHLVAEAFDVVQRIDDEDRVLRHLSLHRGEQSTSRGLFGAGICPSVILREPRTARCTSTFVRIPTDVELVVGQDHHLEPWSCVCGVMKAGFEGCLDLFRTIGCRENMVRAQIWRAS